MEHDDAFLDEIAKRSRELLPGCLSGLAPSYRRVDVHAHHAAGVALSKIGENVLHPVLHRRPFCPGRTNPSSAPAAHLLMRLGGRFALRVVTL